MRLGTIQGGSFEILCFVDRSIIGGRSFWTDRCLALLCIVGFDRRGFGKVCVPTRFGSKLAGAGLPEEHPNSQQAGQKIPQMHRSQFPTRIANGIAALHQ